MTSEIHATSGFSNLFDLRDKVAIVTGASSGLGAEVARGLASHGARVATVARRREPLEMLAHEIGGLSMPCDLRDDAARIALPAAVAERLGPPSILICAAGGIEAISPGEEESIESIERTLAINLTASFRLAQACFPFQVEQQGGSTVFVGSIGGRVGIPGIPQASYAAAKAALGGLGVELAVQWAQHNIRVNTVQPGFFRSEITADLYDTERGQAWLARNTPLPIQGSARDLVGAILWLVSEAGRYVTGQSIVVDGGWTAR